MISGGKQTNEAARVHAVLKNTIILFSLGKANVNSSIGFLIFILEMQKVNKANLNCGHFTFFLFFSTYILILT